MESVKIGSVGLGRLGYEHAKNLAASIPGCVLHAICNVDTSRLRAVAEELGVPHTYTDFAAMCADPELDGIVIVSPSFLHVEQIKIAMEHGKHVFCEKPLAPMWLSARKLKRLLRPIRNWCSNWASCAGLTPPMLRPSAVWTPVKSAKWCWSAPAPRIPAAPLNPH